MSHRLLQGALAHKPPAVRLRRVSVENSGEHRGKLEIKHGGVLPVVNIARYASFRARSDAVSTVERLRAASDAGALEPAQSRVLEEAFSLFRRVRLDHQVRQLERGAQPDNYVDPKEMDALTGRYLRDAFREVASIQRSLASELTWSV